MTRNTNITELDIFNYVFFKEILPQKKIKYIERNKNKFELLNFYRKQKKSTAQRIKEETKKRIAAKIPAYKISKNKLQEF